MKQWEDYLEEAKKHQEQMQKYEDELKETSNDEKPKEENIHGDCDYIWAPSNGGATIMYLAVMIGSAIFTQRILLWVIATIIYINFITRHDK